MAKTITVYANPFLFLDAEGRPAAACPFDPSLAGGARLYVGAELDRKQCRVVRALDPKDRELGYQEERGCFVFKFSEGPLQLPATRYFCARVFGGDLIAGDEATARMCGVDFEDPAVVLERTRARAIAKFRAETGEEPLCAIPATSADGETV